MTRRLDAHPEVLARRIDRDVLVLVHLETNRIFTLNRTGSRVWELLVAGGAADEVERSLAEEYEVGPEQLHQEVTETVDLLLREQLVVEAAEERS